MNLTTALVSNDRWVNSRWKPTVMPRRGRDVHPDQQAEVDPTEAPPPDEEHRRRQPEERHDHASQGNEADGEGDGHPGVQVGV